MTARALTAAAAIVAAIALAGCASDPGASPAPKAATTASTSSTTPATSTTTPAAAVPAIVPRALVEDPGQPSTPALRTAARDFFLSYVAYVYGQATATPGPAAKDLARQMRAQGPVPGLKHLHPIIARLLLHDVTPRSAAVVALVDDGRPSGQLQQIPAQLRLVDGQWQATSVAAGEQA